MRPGSSDWRPNSPKATKLPRVALPLTRPFWLFRYLTRLGIMGIGAALRLQIVALVDPHFNPDMTLRRLGFGEAVVDSCSERAQGDRTEVGSFRPRHLGAAEAS